MTKNQFQPHFHFMSYSLRYTHIIHCAVNLYVVGLATIRASNHLLTPPPTVPKCSSL